LPRVGGTENGENWFSIAFTIDGEQADVYECTFSGSHAEAMRAVHRMIDRLAHQLRAVEFASLVGVSRQERCGGCRDLGDHTYGPGCQYTAPALNLSKVEVRA
jgi:hypothetical protein